MKRMGMGRTPLQVASEEHEIAARTWRCASAIEHRFSHPHIEIYQYQKSLYSVMKPEVALMRTPFSLTPSLGGASRGARGAGFASFAQTDADAFRRCCARSFALHQRLESSPSLFLYLGVAACAAAPRTAHLCSQSAYFSRCSLCPVM
jgi:hypothetical protein